MCTEYSSRRYPRIMSVLEILRKAASFLLESTAKHENDELRKWFPGPPKSGKDLPEGVELDSGRRDRLDDNPRHCEQGANSSYPDDTPPRGLCRLLRLSVLESK